MTDTTFLQGGKKVIGVEPTYATVYQYATNSKSDAIKLPLLKDYRQDMPAMIHAVKANYRDVGFVYLCNPNNPTAMIVTEAGSEAAARLDSRGRAGADGRGVPSLRGRSELRDVDSVREGGRQVIVARTFSKIVGLAGMRLGYAVAPKSVIERMRPFAMSYGVNAVVKWGGAAALADTAAQDKVARSHDRHAQEDDVRAASVWATKRCRRRRTSSWCTSAATSCR